MASDSEIVKGLDDYLKANGYTCGRSYADIGGVARTIAGQLPNESSASVEPKIRRLAAIPTYGFKVKGTGISAPDRSDPDCGTT
jgi:hypothetical protein